MNVSANDMGGISLTKRASGLSKVAVGLGWKSRSTTGVAFDLDVCAIGCKSNNKAYSEQYFVFFNNKSSPEGVIVLSGDNLSGSGAGDDEIITADLTRLPAEVARVVFAASIYEANLREQTFGQVEGALIRLVNDEGSAEMARYDLSCNASDRKAIVFGEVFRQDGKWTMHTIGQHYDSLAAIARHYGIEA